MTPPIYELLKLIGFISLMSLYFYGGEHVWKKINTTTAKKYDLTPLTMDKSYRFLIISLLPIILYVIAYCFLDKQKMTAITQHQAFAPFVVLAPIICVSTYIAILFRKTDLRTALIVSAMLFLASPIAAVKKFTNFFFIILSGLGSGPRISGSSDNWEKINQHHTHKNDYDAGRRRDPPPPIS